METSTEYADDLRAEKMSNVVTEDPPVSVPTPEELKLGRRHSRKAGLFEPELLKIALRQSLIMLRPDIQW